MSGKESRGSGYLEVKKTGIRSPFASTLFTFSRPRLESGSEVYRKINCSFLVLKSALFPFQLTDRLTKLSNQDSNLPSGSDGSSQSGGGTSNSSLTAMLEEELRPRMILQRPQMQILRRPQSQTQEEIAAAESKPKTQIKSLDQRKQAYAEARLRILGSAHDEEEQQQKQIEQ